MPFLVAIQITDNPSIPFLLNLALLRSRRVTSYELRRTIPSVSQRKLIQSTCRTQASPLRFRGVVPLVVYRDTLSDKVKLGHRGIMLQGQLIAGPCTALHQERDPAWRMNITPPCPISTFLNKEIVRRLGKQHRHSFQVAPAWLMYTSRPIVRVVVETPNGIYYKPRNHQKLKHTTDRRTLSYFHPAHLCSGLRERAN